VRHLTGFAGAVRQGAYGRGSQVRGGTVLTALSAVGKTIALDKGIDPTKVPGQKDFIPAVKQMLDGFVRDDPPTMKKLPVEVDVPEWLMERGLQPEATTLETAVGCLTLVAFYYLLRVGEYTVKSSRNDTKRTVQFKMEDEVFFNRNAMGPLRQLGRNAPDSDILTADSTTLKLDDQKNGHKGVCINHEANGDPVFCPNRAVAHRYVYIRAHMNNNWKTHLSAYWDNDGTRRDVTDKDISEGLKLVSRNTWHTN
jgi:hypothetical protein